MIGAPVHDLSGLIDGLGALMHVADDGYVTRKSGQWSEDEVWLVPTLRSEGDEQFCQFWTIEKDSNLKDSFGFKNEATGKYLGANDNGDLQATAEQRREWETFHVTDQGSDIFHMSLKWPQGERQTVCHVGEGNARSLRVGLHATHTAPFVIRGIGIRL